MSTLKLKMQATGISVFSAALVCLNVAGAADNVALIEQIGDSNAMNVAMEGERNSLEFVQEGNANLSEIGLNGLDNLGTVVQNGDLHLSDILITGSSNKFAIAQNGIAEVLEHQNSILLRQEGVGNLATHTQIGTGNRQSLAQLGNDNTADLFQNGNDNSILLEQRGDLNSATLSQIGNSVAPIEIYQTGGMTISVTHTVGGS